MTTWVVWLHCDLDEVAWPLGETEACWFCGQPGSPGPLSAKLTTSDDYYGLRDVPPPTRKATA